MPCVEEGVIPRLSQSPGWGENAPSTKTMSEDDVFCSPCPSVMRPVGTLLGPVQCLGTLPLDSKQDLSAPFHSDVVSGLGVSGPASFPTN